MDLTDLFHLFWQIGRITLFITAGLFITSMIEALNLSHRLAIFSRPLIRMGHLSTVTGASFSLAFFSGVTANTMLAEAYDNGEMSHRELLLANLFNSLPRFVLHLPTVFFLTAPFIHYGAFLYVGLTFAIAIVQTAIVVIAGRLLLPPSQKEIATPPEKKKINFYEAFAKSKVRIKKRLLKIMRIMVPIYILFFIAAQMGFFAGINDFLARHIWFLAWLKPEALVIITLHITTELSAGLAAASALLAENSLSVKEVVLALLVGNILAAPIRAIRHQFPYYSGIYPPKLAVKLVGVSQLVRIFCTSLITSFYALIG